MLRSDIDNSTWDRVCSEFDKWYKNKDKGREEYIDSLSEEEMRKILKEVTTSAESAILNSLHIDEALRAVEILGHIYGDETDWSLPPLQFSMRKVDRANFKALQDLRSTSTGIDVCVSAFTIGWNMNAGETAVRLLKEIKHLYDNSNIDLIYYSSARKLLKYVDEQIDAIENWQ